MMHFENCVTKYKPCNIMKKSYVPLLIAFCLMVITPSSTAETITKTYSFNSPMGDIFDVQLDYPKTMYYGEEVVMNLKINVKVSSQNDLVRTSSAVIILPGGEVDVAIPAEYKKPSNEEFFTLVFYTPTNLNSGDLNLKINYAISYPGAKYDGYRTEVIGRVNLQKKPSETTSPPTSPPPPPPTFTTVPPRNPGFETISAISGILIVAYLSRKIK